MSLLIDARAAALVFLFSFLSRVGKSGTYMYSSVGCGDHSTVDSSADLMCVIDCLSLGGGKKKA